MSWVLVEIWKSNNKSSICYIRACWIFLQVVLLYLTIRFLKSVAIRCAVAWIHFCQAINRLGISNKIFSCQCPSHNGTVKCFQIYTEERILFWWEFEKSIIIYLIFFIYEKVIISIVHVAMLVIVYEESTGWRLFLYDGFRQLQGYRFYQSG
jgi:hypothetical protein